MTLEVSVADARRMALNAQGFGVARPGRASIAALRKLAHRLQVVQIDAVNVLARSHYIPAFSRLGPYKPELLDDLAYRKRELYEANAHAHSLVTVDHHPLLRHRMDAHRTTWWEPTKAKIEAQHPGYVDRVVAEVRERGPLSFTDLTDPGRREKVPTKYSEASMAWWRWSDGKLVLDNLGGAGVLTVAGRRGFDVLYDLTERVIPAEVLALPTPAPADAQRELVRRAVVAMGIATVKEIADYYRLKVAETKAALADLVAAGDVVAASVEGVKGFADPGASAQRVDARALVSPFDSLVWERKRSVRLFDFAVSFEIYVPPAKRRYGYFVLPFILGEQIVARADLKADRSASMLLVPGAFAEPGAAVPDVVEALAAELRDVATWLGLDAIAVGERGELASPLKRALR